MDKVKGRVVVAGEGFLKIESIGLLYVIFKILKIQLSGIRDPPDWETGG